MNPQDDLDRSDFENDREYALFLIERAPQLAAAAPLCDECGVPVVADGTSPREGIWLHFDCED